MSLRLKLVLLIAATILIPLSMLAITLRFGFDYKALLALEETFSSNEPWRIGLIDRPVGVDDLEEELSDVPRKAHIQVYDGGGKLLFERTVENDETGNNPFTVSETIPISFTDGRSGEVVITAQYMLFYRRQIPYRLSIPLAVVLFMALMSILIVRSINRSIRKLESATRRIADGDLEFKLSSDGRDKLASLTRSFDTIHPLPAIYMLYEMDTLTLPRNWTDTRP
jgi:methyl-accepting chemotaxis protein